MAGARALTTLNVATRDRAILNLILNLSFSRKRVPESVHAQAAANDECVAFSVVFPGSWLRFAASVRRFATVVVVES